MAEERIDIQVTDKGADRAAKNLRTIADEADRGASYVERLKAALASINASPVDRLARASAAATNALARETTAAAKLATAQGNAAVATARAATEQQRLATETARTAAAESRAAAAAAQAERAAMTLAAATDRAAQSKSNLYNRANALKSALDPAYAAQMRFNAEINEANTLLRAGVISMGTYQQAVGAADARLKAFSTDTLPMMVNGMRAGRIPTANIAAQVNDLGVQFAMAAQSGNPLQMVFMALIQQGSQLSYIASTMNGGWRALLATMGGMVARFLPVIAVVGLLVAALAKLKSEAASDSELKKFAGTLGLTKKEMEELKDVTVTWGDTFGATMDVILERAGTDSAQVAAWFKDAFSKIGEFAKFSVAIIYAAFFTGFRAIGRIVIGLPRIVGAAVTAIVNGITAAVEGMVNLAIKGINWLANQAEKVTSKVGITFEDMGDVSLGRLQNNFSDVFGEIGQGIKDDLYGSFADANKLMDDISKRAGERARDRLRKQAREIIEDRTDKKGPKAKVDHTAEKRAHALAMVNLELDKEISRMRMLKDERAIQQRMDQIEESLAQKKIKLNDAERASIRAKVTEIERFKYVQAEMDRITEEADGPRRTLNASIEAANYLLSKGAIDQARYNQELFKAKQAYAEATDPLHQMKQALDSQAKTLGVHGVELERANYLEQIRQAYLAKGIDLATQSTAAIRGEIAALVARNDALRQQQFVQQQVAAIIDPMLQNQREIDAREAMYVELQRLRDNDLINEQMYHQARAQLWMKANATNLSIVADGFGAIADATKHGHGVIGAISKAAAVAQAVIQGYVAVQNALATVPYPFNYVAAAAVAVKTGTQVAGIISTNVGGYKDGGQFIVGGRGGVDANNINMDVTRGERVTIETVKQQRANDNQANAPTVNANTKVVNLFDEKTFIGAMDSDEGERVVMNIIRRNSDGILAMGANA